MNSNYKRWLDVLKNLRSSWRQVLLAHLVFTALGFVLFSPLITGVGRLLLKISGQTAFDDQDIIYFFLSPLGMFAMILMLALLITVLAFEQAALLRIAVGTRHGQEISVVEALFFTASRAKQIFGFILILVTRVVVMTVPFLLAAYGVALLLVGEFDIGYYLSQTPVEFWWTVTFVSLIVLIMVVLLVRKLLGWSMALPLILFDCELPRRSFSSSAGVTRDRLFPVFIAFLVWGAAAILPALFLIGMIKLIGSSAVPVVWGSIPILVILLGGLSLLWMMGNFLITSFTSGSFAGLLLEFYESCGPGVGALAAEAGRPGIGQLRIAFSAKNLALALLASVTVAGLVGVWLVEGIKINDDVLVIAHRGAAGKAPENTPAAFRQAIDDRADWIELDVQETADGAVLVFHDSDFMKLAGKELKVGEASLSDAQDIDIGSWFDPAFSAERAPTLQEVLDTAKGRVNVVIELKHYGHDQMLEQRVVDIVEASGMVDNTAIMSLQYGSIKKIRSLRPDWQIGLISAKVIGDLTGLDTDFLAVETRMVRSGFIRRAHRAGRKVFVWTVNDPVTMSRMMSLGVDGIITDEPELARQTIQHRKDMNIAERLLLHSAIFFGQPYTPDQYRDSSP